MKLNHDCVRLLLLEIESNKKIGEPLTRHNFNDNIIFDKYDFETVMYSLLKLEESKFICCDLKFIEGRVVSWLLMTSLGLAMNFSIILETIKLGTKLKESLTKHPVCLLILWGN